MSTVWMAPPAGAVRLAAITLAGEASLRELATHHQRAQLLSHPKRLGLQQYAVQPPLLWRPGQRLFARLRVMRPGPVFLTAHFEMLEAVV